jgi:hypothetical protein
MQSRTPVYVGKWQVEVEFGRLLRPFEHQRHLGCSSLLWVVAAEV